MILEALEQVAAKHGVRVIYACESGSRAWGFASPDSDFDVRFLYVHPVEWYLTIDKGRDVIEEMLPGDLDLSGWELRKALGLLRKSNPPMLEWIDSPCVYFADEKFFSRLREARSAFFSPLKTFHHYLSMARTNNRTYLQGETVRLKKYLYVMRPLLAARFIERVGLMPPVEFSALVERMADEPGLRQAIERLLDLKRSSAEMDDGARDPVLSGFIEVELGRLGAVSGLKDVKADTRMLDELLRWAVVGE